MKAVPPDQNELRERVNRANFKASSDRQRPNREAYPDHILRSLISFRLCNRSLLIPCHLGRLAHGILECGPKGGTLAWLA